MVISPTFDFSRAISSSRSSRSRSFRAVAAPESARSRHSVSLATETFVSRATSSNGSPRNNRATTANLRLTEKRFGPFPSTPEGAPAPALGERSGAPSGLRPSSFVMSDTPVEAQSTSAGCLNYPCRTPVVRVEHHLLRLARIGSHEQHATVAEPDVGGLHGHRHAAQQDDLVAPVELVGFSWSEAQRNKGCSCCLPALLGPSPRVATHRIIAALISASAQFLEQPDQRQALT